MKITNITAVHNNYTSFKNKNSKNVSTKVEKPMNAEEKILLGVKCLGVIALAGITRIVLKENNVNLVEIAKNSIKNIGRTLEDKPPQSEIMKKLNGRRDNEAIKIYDNYIAMKKQNSLTDKILNDVLNVKSNSAYKHVAKNLAELQRKSV